ncbi:MAG: response regulator transcription factor [Verrucomicrobia bacterium]|nr:response regulator transcription factor [Verrucomicrobiota bacterium]
MKPPGKTPSRPAPKTAAKHSVFLVDDHPLTRMGIAMVIDQQPDLKVTGQASSPKEAISLLEKKTPDLLVTDLSMSGRDGTDFLLDIHAILPDLPILVHSMHPESSYALSCLQAEAKGYVMKEKGAEVLIEAVRFVLSGKRYASPDIMQQLLDIMSTGRPPNSSPLPPLSSREFTIYEAIGEGLKTREIAAKLGINHRTVDAHRSNIRTKLKLPDFAALTVHAVRWVESKKKRSV